MAMEYAYSMAIGTLLRQCAGQQHAMLLAGVLSATLLAAV